MVNQIQKNQRLGEAECDQVITFYKIKAEDAQNRRDEAYQYALSISSELRSWRSRYESLRHDLQAAINGPFEGVRQVSISERGHQQIIQAVSEQFPGCVSTHYLERDEILVGVDKMRQKLEDLLSSSSIECGVAGNTESVLKIRNGELIRENQYLRETCNALRASNSWKITKPLRVLFSIIK